VLLLKFRLVRLEHADLAPSIEKQSDGSHPQDQDKNDDQDFLGSHHYRARSCNPWLNPLSYEVYKNYATKEQKTLYKFVLKDYCLKNIQREYFSINTDWY